MTEDNVAIVFIHGATGSHLTWKFQKAGLSNRIKVIAVDLPGHLDLNCPEVTDLELYITFLNDKLENLKLERIILCGHSMGGAVALSYHLRNPDKVDGIILIGTGARLRVLPIILELTKNNFPQFIGMVKNTAFHAKTIKKNPNLIKEVEENMARIPSHIVHCNYKICDKFDVMDKLGDIKVPTLIICGSDDKLTPIKYSGYMEKHIPNSNLQIVNDAGHMVMLEQPEVVNKAIEDFIIKIVGH